MRHVHWPSTARHGAVMVREFEAGDDPAARDRRGHGRRRGRGVDAARRRLLGRGVGGAGRRRARPGRPAPVARAAARFACSRTPARTSCWRRLANLEPRRPRSPPTLSGGLGESLRGIESALLVLPTLAGERPPSLVVPAVRDARRRGRPRRGARSWTPPPAARPRTLPAAPAVRGPRGLRSGRPGGRRVPLVARRARSPTSSTRGGAGVRLVEVSEGSARGLARAAGRRRRRGRGRDRRRGGAGGGGRTHGRGARSCSLRSGTGSATGSAIRRRRRRRSCWPWG